MSAFVESLTQYETTGRERPDLRLNSCRRVGIALCCDHHFSVEYKCTPVTKSLCQKVTFRNTLGTELTWAKFLASPKLPPEWAILEPARTLYELSQEDHSGELRTGRLRQGRTAYQVQHPLHVDFAKVSSEGAYFRLPTPNLEVFRVCYQVQVPQTSNKPWASASALGCALRTMVRVPDIH